jgi:hypothetical protein
MIIDPLQRFRPGIVVSVTKIAICDVSGTKTSTFNSDFTRRTVAKLAVTQQRNSGPIGGREYEVLAGGTPPTRIPTSEKNARPQIRTAPRIRAAFRFQLFGIRGAQIRITAMQTSNASAAQMAF